MKLPTIDNLHKENEPKESAADHTPFHCWPDCVRLPEGPVQSGAFFLLLLLSAYKPADD
jgi:hypothetical protein